MYLKYNKLCAYAPYNEVHCTWRRTQQWFPKFFLLHFCNDEPVWLPTAADQTDPKGRFEVQTPQTAKLSVSGNLPHAISW